MTTDLGGAHGCGQPPYFKRDRKRVTIRRLLLAAFLLVSLLPAATLTVLAFDRTRAAMLGEIELGVRRSADALSIDVDRLISERLLNATTWNHLEVMQDLRLDDVDKRLSNFLAEIKHRYGGAYLDLLAIDPAGRIVSSSSAARISQGYAPADVWFSVEMAGGHVELDRVRNGRVSIRTPIESAFTAGQLGQLVLELDWRQVEQLLDAAADPQRQALLLDSKGAVVAASSGLRARGALPGAPAPGLRDREADTARARDGRPWMDVALLVGTAQSAGTPAFAGFGWTTLLLQSREAALAPVRRMAFTFAGLLAATVLVTILASFWVAGMIARPISALTAFTRRYLQPGPPPPTPTDGPGEIGELSRSFVHMVDELQRSQATLIQASKLAALGEVTALMAHEVRTPLGILRSSAQMLRTEPQLSAEGGELVRIIESETERLNRLVSSMLDSARTRAPRRQRDDLHSIIRHALSLLAAQIRDHAISVDLALKARDAFAECDSEQITQLILNLVMNALQVLPRHGHIQIITRDGLGRIVVEVADDGPGIPVEERTRIFEPFVFKREGGVGLGLAVVKQIVRQHGGDIVADASPLGGALLRFWLPRTIDT